MSREPGEEISAENLSGLERATVILLSMEEDVSAQVMSQLEQSDIQQLTGSAGRMPAVDQTISNTVLEDFLNQMAGGGLITGRQSRGKIRNILEKFLPEDKIDEYMEQVMFGVDLSEGFESIRYVDPQTLAAYVKNEHPQTIALILAHLQVEKAAQVLPLLPQESQTDVILRIAALDRISPRVVRNVQEVFVHEILASGANKSRQVGGADSVAELMNFLDSHTTQSIFAELEEVNPSFCEDIRQRMFVFGDLEALDDRGLQQIIKEVTNEVITLAMKTASEVLKQKIFKNISSRAAEMIQEELEVMGPVKLTDVEEAQQEIVGIARRLEEEGKIVLGATGGGEELV